MRFLSLALSVVIVLASLLLIGYYSPEKERVALQRTPGVQGQWSESDAAYVSAGITATFSEDIEPEQRQALAEIFDYSLTLLPRHLIKTLDGLTVTFTEHVLCNKEEKMGCFRESTFSAKIRVVEPLSKHRTDLARILIHEYAHALDARHSFPDRWLFSELHTTNQHRVNDYAGQNAKEDFAESFEYFIFQPATLRSCCPARFAFLEKRIFDEEFFSVVERSRTPTTLEQYALASSLAMIGLLALAVILDFAAFVLGGNVRLHKTANIVFYCALLFAALALGLFLGNLYINKNITFNITSLL